HRLGARALRCGGALVGLPGLRLAPRADTGRRAALSRRRVRGPLLRGGLGGLLAGIGGLLVLTRRNQLGAALARALNRELRDDLALLELTICAHGAGATQPSPRDPSSGQRGDDRPRTVSERRFAGDAADPWVDEGTDVLRQGDPDVLHGRQAAVPSPRGQPQS